MIHDHLTMKVLKTTNGGFERKNVEELFPDNDIHPFDLIAITGFVLIRCT